jgi:hypothetical protein
MSLSATPARTVRVLQVAEQLEAAGVRLWLDRTQIPGGAN